MGNLGKVLAFLGLAALIWTSPVMGGESVEYAIPSSLATKSLLLDVAHAGKRLVAVGEWGHILLSDDAGDTWRQASVPTRTTLTEVTFADERHGWVVGHDAIVLHTSDGGETWEMQFSDPENEGLLLSIWCENLKHCVASGIFGTIIETEDGGDHWKQMPPLDVDGEEPHLMHLFEGSEKTLFIAAEFGTVFRSRDSGKTWEPLSVHYEGSLWGGLALKDGTILVMGLRGHAFRSTDMGESWTSVTTDTTQSLQAGIQFQDGTVVLVGLGGAVAVSRDDGKTFVTEIEKDRLGISAVAEGSGGQLLLFGEGGFKKRPVPQVKK